MSQKQGPVVDLLNESSNSTKQIKGVNEDNPKNNNSISENDQSFNLNNKSNISMEYDQLDYSQGNSYLVQISKRYLDQKKIPPPINQYADNLSGAVVKKMYDNIFVGNIIINESNILFKFYQNKTSLDDLIAKNNETKYDKMEEISRKQKLKDVKSMKSELQSKLQQLQENIEILENQQTSQKEKGIKNARYQSYDMDFYKDEKHADQMKRIMHERRMLEQKRQQYILEREAQMQEEIKQQQEQQKQQKEQQYAQRKEQVLQSIQQICQRREQRVKDVQQTNKKFVQIISSKPLFMEVEQRYSMQSMQSLQEKKKYLEELRKLHQPMDFDNINKFDNEYLTMKKKKEEARLQEQSQCKYIYHKPTYESEAYKQWKNDIQKDKQQMEQKIKKVKEIQDKMKSYALQAQKEHQPKIDPVKELEVKVKREKVTDKKASQGIPRNPNTGEQQTQVVDQDANEEYFEQDDANTDKKIRQIGLSNLEYSKQLSKKKKNIIMRISTQQQRLNGNTNYSAVGSSPQDGNQFQDNTNNTGRRSQQKNKQDLNQQIDYLRSNKDYIHQKFSEILTSKLEKQIANNKLSEQEKIQLLNKESYLIEKRAKMQDDLLKVSDNDEGRQEVANLYVASIKAKLAILSGGNNQDVNKQ